MLSSSLFRKSPVRQRGALGQLLADRRARRAAPDAGAGSSTPPTGVTAGQTQLNIEAEQAGGGVELKAIPKYTRFRKRQLKYAEKAPLYMAPVITALKRFRETAESEWALRSRITAVAPELLATRSPWLTRIIAGVLLCGSIVLGASTYSAFSPSREDRIAALLKTVDLDVSWLLGAAQVSGLTVLGYCIAHCLGFALVARLAAFKRGDSDGDRGGEPVVHGTYTPRTYGILAGGVFAFALGVVYAIAKLRGYSLSVDAAVGASTPTGGAAGSLGAGAAPQPQQIGIFLMLCSLELIATIVAFLVLDGPVSHVLRALESSTRKAGKHLIRVGNKANKYRVRGAWAGIDANRVLAEAAGHSAQARRGAVRLEAIRRGANPATYGHTFEPDMPPTTEVLPAPAPPAAVAETPVAYGAGNSPADLLDLLRDDATDRVALDGRAAPTADPTPTPAPTLEQVLRTPLDPDVHDGRPQPSNGHRKLDGAASDATEV